MMLTSPILAFGPEIKLILFGMAAILCGAFWGDKTGRKRTMVLLVPITGIGVALGSFLGFLTLGTDPLAAGPVSVFHGALILDRFACFVKVILLVAAALSIMMSWGWLENEGLARFEYPVLVLFATLGMMLMVSAGDFLSLYVGLELQSLALYVLAAFRRDDLKSSESGLKYFVLGALSSGLILYGISLIYGYAGTVDFAALEKIAGMHYVPSPCATGCTSNIRAVEVPIGALFGLVFICAALAFKVSAVPFHMWTPDVYEGAPTPVTAFFSAAPKVAALALFTRVLVQPFGGLAHQWAQIVIFTAVASMLLGSFAGLVQSNVKRLLAYSAIANAGYALVGLAVGGDSGIQALLLYLAIYFLNTLGAFGVVLCLRRAGKPAEQMTDLSGLAKTNPLLAFAMVVFMFSLAGVPPLAGFFGKYFIFLAAVRAGMIPLAVIGVLSSVVSAYYYLRVVKLMYFDDAASPVDAPRDFGLRASLAFTAAVMLLFVLWPSPVIDGALAAAHSLTGG